MKVATFHRIASILNYNDFEHKYHPNGDCSIYATFPTGEIVVFEQLSQWSPKAAYHQLKECIRTFCDHGTTLKNFKK